MTYALPAAPSADLFGVPEWADGELNSEEEEDEDLEEPSSERRRVECPTQDLKAASSGSSPSSSLKVYKHK